MVVLCSMVIDSPALLSPYKPIFPPAPLFDSPFDLPSILTPMITITTTTTVRNNLDTINIQVSRLELVFKRKSLPLTSAWETFLGCACRDNMMQKGLLDQDTCGYLAQDMSKNILDEDLQRTCLSLIEVCCKSHEDNQRLMGDVGIVARVVKAMRG